MADIQPLRGVLYDPRRVNLGNVLVPPHGVLSPAELRQLEERDSHNFIRLLVPENGSGHAVSRLLHEWLAHGVLVRDRRPALYRVHQLFTPPEGGVPVLRKSFVASVRLPERGESVIRPHELTLSTPRAERLDFLTRARAHLAPVFGLYRDAEAIVDTVFGDIERTAPWLSGTTPDGTTHRVWRVVDATSVARVHELLGPWPIYIADGHHRIETQLALRDSTVTQATSSDDPVRFTTMFLARSDDPGVRILPTHRLLHSLAQFSMKDLARRAGERFDIRRVPGGARSARVIETALAAAAVAAPAFGLVVPGEDDAWLLHDRTPAAPGRDASTDIVLLHDVVFQEILGIDRTAQANQQHIEYVENTGAALWRVQAGAAQAGFLVRAPAVSDVLAAADRGAVMPQKSTCFHPKLPSGLVTALLD